MKQSGGQPPRHSPGLIFLRVLTWLCNLFDLWYTFLALDFARNAYEANPFYRAMLEHPYLAVVYKFSLVPFGLYLLYKCRAYTVARFGVCLCALFFLGNTLYQIWIFPLWA